MRCGQEAMSAGHQTILPLNPKQIPNWANQAMSTRREKIEQMLADEPQDTFLRYSLAMELDKEGRHSESLQIFQQLRDDVPPYVPAFFMAGQQLARLGRVEEARDVLSRGIAEAQQQQDLHAAGEMGDFLASLA